MFTRFEVGLCVTGGEGGKMNHGWGEAIKCGYPRFDTCTIQPYGENLSEVWAFVFHVDLSPFVAMYFGGRIQYR